jgi:hypothetical protein
VANAGSLPLLNNYSTHHYLYNYAGNHIGYQHFFWVKRCGLHLIKLYLTHPKFQCHAICIRFAIAYCCPTTNGGTNAKNL